MKILIVDGHSIAHRAFHAVKVHLTAPDGTPTAMIMAFMNMLFKVEEELKPDKIIAVFDAGGKNFRHELLPEYKATRKPLADDLKIQLPILQDLLKFAGHYVISRVGVEADDLVASCAVTARKFGHVSAILSSDKDLMQILGNGVLMIRPVQNGISGAEKYTAKTFFDEYNFVPELMPDYLALTGDTSDNVPGVQGIGSVSAKKLVSEFGSIENIFNSLEKITAKATRNKFQNTTLEKVLRTREIIKLKLDLISDEFFNECMDLKPDIQSAIELASKLGLTRVKKYLDPSGQVKLKEPEPDKINLPEYKIIVDDLKNELVKDQALDIKNIFDVRTAYYLLHPDSAAKKFADVIENIKANQNPAMMLLKTAAELENQIKKYSGLFDVMNNIDKPLLPVLVKMEEHGVRIDNAKFFNVQSDLQNRLNEIEYSVTRSSGVRINLQSSQQVSWLLFEKLGFIPEAKTKGKTSYATGAGVLEKLAALENGEIPRLILEHRELSKMLNSFVIPFQRAADKNGIIHTTFEASSTGTGRLSSRDPNLQNIPAIGKWADEIKSGLIPVNPENVFVSADYSQIELRVLAFMSGSEKLIEAFKNDRDIHTETASWVFNTAPEFITPDLRRTAKMINFGLLYGMSSFGLAERLNISRGQAKEIIEKYFNALPELKTFMKNIVNEAKLHGYSKTLYGRIRPVNEIPAVGQGLERALINTPIQGTAADIARQAMLNYSRESEGLFLQVHDSLVCECPKNKAEHTGNLLASVMKDIRAGDIKLDVNVKTGNTLAGV